MTPALNLGAWRQLDGSEGGRALRLPSAHLVTHGVVAGMTGSGKTGLVTVMIEEAARAQVPTLMIDVKGDLPNLLLAFPDFAPTWVEPWLDAGVHPASYLRGPITRVEIRREGGCAPASPTVRFEGSAFGEETVGGTQRFQSSRQLDAAGVVGVVTAVTKHQFHQITGAPGASRSAEWC
jgi:Bacterial protein of unknown function (DUF853)